MSPPASMRSLVASALLAFALPAASQGVTYDVGYGLPGNGFDYSGLTDGEGFVLASHEAFGVQVPLVSLRAADAAQEIGVRAAYVRLEFMDPEPGADSTSALPGLYGYLVTDWLPGGGVMGVSLTGQIGYDVYQKESALALAWVPHAAGGFGPVVRLGPVDFRAHAVGQLSSLLQGAGLYLRFGVSIAR